MSAVGVIMSAVGVIMSAVGVIMSAVGVIMSAVGVIMSAVGVIMSAVGGHHVSCGGHHVSCGGHHVSCVGHQASPPPPPKPTSLAASGGTTLDPVDHVYLEPHNHQEAGPPAMRAVVLGDANTAAITAMADLLQSSTSSRRSSHPPLRRLTGHTTNTSLPPRHPRDPLPTPPPPPTEAPSPPALPPRNMGPGGAPAPSRPQKRATLTVKTEPCLATSKEPPIATSKEPPIPRDWTILCPLCRSPCGTSKLQTNRYVLAHLRDLARLQPRPEPALTTHHQPIQAQAANTQPSAPTLALQDFWCIKCEAPAQDCCASHDLLPLHQWLETQGDMVEELRTSIQSRLNDLCCDLDHTEDDIKIIQHSLRKASSQVWRARQEAQGAEQQLGCQVEQLAPAPCPRRKAQDMAHRTASLRDLEGRVSNLAAWTGNDEVYLYRQNNKLYVCTSQPDRTIIITISQGQRQT
ncbi:uncharacterized protein [Panulirus ornatus]|uniref:uncharacterized protein isoform X2 n=1 Tax=Panulirus ornatus TaxID=150431 RepID=UPI003A8BCBA7